MSNSHGDLKRETTEYMNEDYDVILSHWGLFYLSSAHKLKWLLSYKLKIMLLTDWQSDRLSYSCAACIVVES